MHIHPKIEHILFVVIFSLQHTRIKRDKCDNKNIKNRNMKKKQNNNKKT